MSESTTIGVDGSVETRLDAIGASEQYERFVASQQQLAGDDEVTTA